MSVVLSNELKDLMSVSVSRKSDRVMNIKLVLEESVVNNNKQVYWQVNKRNRTNRIQNNAAFYLLHIIKWRGSRNYRH